MPSGPGVIDDARIADIAAHVGNRARTFLLTSRQSAGAVIAQHRAAGTSTLQLVDAMAPGAHAALRAALPGVELVQVIHVTDETSIAEARAIAPHVDALLLDSGNPALATKELGGTGRAHDWSLSARIVEAVDVPVYLAGGLRAHNVAQAIATVRPYGLDLCTGVRMHGMLDDVALARFMAAVRGDGDNDTGADARPHADASATERLVDGLLCRTLPKAEWTHEAHLRAGVWMVRTYGTAAAIGRLRVAIRTYNVAVGGRNTSDAGYHETITQAYVRLIAYVLTTLAGGAADIDALGDVVLREIGDRAVLGRYWSRDRLMSVTARREWVDPDLAPLPVA